MVVSRPLAWPRYRLWTFPAMMVVARSVEHMAANKQRLSVLEQAAHAILSPAGFVKQKSTWRRRLPEVLQQFAIVSMQLGTRYRPE
jgi:hypothetical protein